MKATDIHSLGRRTDLIFAEFLGEVQERDQYIAIKTPSNSSYHWGNYLIFNRAPQKGASLLLEMRRISKSKLAPFRCWRYRMIMDGFK